MRGEGRAEKGERGGLSGNVAETAFCLKSAPELNQISDDVVLLLRPILAASAPECVRPHHIKSAVDWIHRRIELLWPFSVFSSD